MTKDEFLKYSMYGLGIQCVEDRERDLDLRFRRAGTTWSSQDTGAAEEIAIRDNRVEDQVKICVSLE